MRGRTFADSVRGTTIEAGEVLVNTRPRREVLEFTRYSIESAEETAGLSIYTGKGRILRFYFITSSPIRPYYSGCFGLLLLYSLHVSTTEHERVGKRERKFQGHRARKSERGLSKGDGNEFLTAVSTAKNTPHLLLLFCGCRRSSLEYGGMYGRQGKVA